ncbi:hypothetical protein SE17_18715 [Kouleothrix aurantiaca]|uniref:Uncharacterized protein n=1 Tax=Kouleothrix aurantiaca TaxID=186479 RepID=A0A0P9DP65_9CHLR|nr:hypothetical protein SE17_18715 [Kouleothrix aurantiaca]
MLAMKIEITPTPDDDTVAAIVAALAAYDTGAPEELGAAGPHASMWAAANRQAAQGLPPPVTPTPRWAEAERARRAERWSSGIVGL